ncbi:MAG TPA: nitroreductase family deazaflavin-dependent oxidoreductase [Candidatus Saccharimonadales bacterium]|nr:nitroreductase family deazaflavin-dependent oxidoreductase [Candidatus Saccharimonadales bacterium]
MEDFNKKIIEEFRANKGIVGGMFNGMPLLLVTTIGAKSGKEVTIPVAYSMDGDNYVIVASKGGAPENPAWYYNLLAHPEVTIEVGEEKFQVRAHDTKDEERERLFDQHAAKYPAFNDYKAKTSRVIPVLVLKKI